MRLPELVREIAEKLVEDNWVRLSTSDGSDSFCVIGSKTWDRYKDDPSAYSNWESAATGKPTPWAEWFSRSQLAGKHRNYLEQECKMLEELSPVELEAFVKFVRSGLEDSPELSQQQQLKMAVIYQRNLEAALVVQHPDRLARLTNEAREHMGYARAKLCLHEVATRYAKMVDRWEQLDLLPFADPQLEEATRTYLYGFYRASILLGAAALETELNRIVGRDDGYNKFDELAKLVARGALTSECRDWAKDVFKKRNRVAHQNWVPGHDEAKELLGVARKVLPELRAVQP